MKRMIIAIALLALGLALPLRAAGLKLAVVDMERLMKAHPETRTAVRLLGKENEAFQDEQRAFLAEREEMKESLGRLDKEARSSALSDKAREKKLDELSEQLEKLQAFTRERQEELSRRRSELKDQEVRMFLRTEEKIHELIGKVADKRDLDLVLDRAGRGSKGLMTVAHAADALDITDEVLELIEPEEGEEE